jgi:hypothetical protein
VAATSLPLACSHDQLYIEWPGLWIIVHPGLSPYLSRKRLSSSSFAHVGQTGPGNFLHHLFCLLQWPFVAGQMLLQQCIWHLNNYHASDMDQCIAKGTYLQTFNNLGSHDDTLLIPGILAVLLGETW